MVSISSQEIEISVDEIEWSNREYSGALPNNFEATARILINGLTCFEEPISVGELILQLREWSELARDGQMRPFNFNSIDTEENPILSINYNSEKSMWMLSTKPNVCQTYPINDLAAASLLRRLHAALEDAILNKFGRVIIAW